MPLPDELRRVLPDDTARTWEQIAPVVPEAAYLAGGTGIAVHIGHRVSRDLDFFYHAAGVDLDELADRLHSLGTFAVTTRSSGTLNGLYNRTKVQFLHADEGRPQYLLEPPSTVEGIRVAGLSDLIALKLKVIGDRGELRDYFDLMMIERITQRRVEEGIELFLNRFRPADPQGAVRHILLGLGYFDDVDDDAALPVERDEIVAYWTKRLPDVLAVTGSLG